MYRGERGEGEKGPVPVAQERTKLARRARGLARWRGGRVKQKTVERSDSHPGAGRRNIKGNRLLVREVKNRPSPGHTRIALYTYFTFCTTKVCNTFWARRAAWRWKCTRGITQISFTSRMIKIFSKSFVSFMLFLFIFYSFMLLIFLHYKKERALA